MLTRSKRRKLSSSESQDGDSEHQSKDSQSKDAKLAQTSEKPSEAQSASANKVPNSNEGPKTSTSQTRKIEIKQLTGQTVSLNVDLNDTMDKLKATVRPKFGLPDDRRCELIFGGRILEGTKTIRDYEIIDDSVLFLVVVKSIGDARHTRRIDFATISTTSKAALRANPDDLELEEARQYLKELQTLIGSPFAAAGASSSAAGGSAASNGTSS